jgi:hypothetical protein
MTKSNKKVYTGKEISLMDSSSLQELLTKFDVDTNVWEVTKYITNIWGNSNNPNHQVKAWLEKKIQNVDNREDFVREMVEEIKKYSVQVAPRIHRISTEKNVLVVNLSDLHLGRLSWAVETGFGNYDIKIATDIVNEAVDVLLRRANGFNVEKIVFLLGGDYFNYNTSNPFPQTVNGTPQESDVRQPRMFRIGRELACKQIERFSQYAPVDVLVISGNHDHELIFGLGEVLEAKYENNANINIDNVPKMRKYISYGTNLIGASHGKYERKAKLPMLMANEAKEAWAKTEHRYFHIGHRHHEIAEDKDGVILLTAPTPAEVNSHEAQMGYTMSNRAIKAWVYNYNDGEIASFTHNIKSKY